MELIFFLVKQQFNNYKTRKTAKKEKNPLNTNPVRFSSRKIKLEAMVRNIGGSILTN